MMQLALYGLSHRTARLETREGVAFSPDQVLALLTRLRERRVEGAVFSTCNRVEICLGGAPPSELGETARALAAEVRPAFGQADAQGATYLHVGSAAARHLCRVAAGLDSAVLGEAQILGQVRESHRLAVEVGAVGPLVDRLFQTALAAGKRVRSETDIGTGAVSVSSAAVELASKIFDDLSRYTALLLGAGENGELTARLLSEKGVGRLMIANRTLSKAKDLADLLSGRAIPFEDLPRALEEADIVIGSTGASHVVVDRAMMERALKGRGKRPVALIDIAVPRDFDPAIGKLDSCFLYHIDDLTRIIDQHLADRARHVPRAERIVEEEAARFEAWVGGQSVAPVIRDLNQHFEDVLRDAMTQHSRQFSKDEWDRVEIFARSLLKKLLHRPVTRLRDSGPNGHPGTLKARILVDLFGLGARETHADDPDRDAQ